jgi:FtsH-binding integral membrane protein
MAQVYLLMSVGMIVTALVATWVTGNLALQYTLLSSPMLAFGLFILQIIIVVALSAAVMRLSPGVGIALPVTALGIFLGMRAWSIKISKESASEDDRKSKITTEPASQETVED